MEIEGVDLTELPGSIFIEPKDAKPSIEEKDLLDRVKSASAPCIGNLGYLAVSLAQKVERFMNAKINNFIQESSKIQKTIDQLVDLNGKLSIHNDNENEKTITDEIRELCKSLKENGIDILSEKETKLTRERLAEIKANVSAHTDRLKTDLQILFTTKIQVSIQEIQSVLDSAKRTEEYSRSSKIIGNMKGG